MKYLLLLCGLLGAMIASAQQVNYLGEQFRFRNMILLESATDSLSFYYLPTSLRVADAGKGKALSLTKHTGMDDDSPRGGLFNIAFTLDLPDGELMKAEKYLAAKIPGASLRGRVPLWADAESGRPVSYLISQLKDKAEVLAMSTSPATVEGSRANLGLLLKPEETTLLGKSLEMASADLALVTELYYEAVVTDLSVRITAPAGPVYRKLAASGRETFTERDILKMAQGLTTNRNLKIEWLAGAGGEDDTTNEQRELLAERVITLLLHRFLAPASAPSNEPKAPVRYRLNNSKLVREDSISIFVSADRRLRVPVTLTGQAGGIVTPENREEYIRFLAFEKAKVRSPVCYIRPDLLPAFPTVFSSVRLEIRGKESGVRELISFSDTLDKRVTIPLTGTEEYEFRTTWRHGPSLRTLLVDWAPLSGLSLPLTPPLTALRVTLVRSPTPPPEQLRHVVVFRGKVAGEPTELRTISYATDEKIPDTHLTLFHDPGTLVEAEITTISRAYDGTKKQLKIITNDYLLQL